MENLTEKQVEFLENCLVLHEKMEEGYIPTEFEVMRLMIDLDDCNECGSIRNGKGIRSAATSYIYGREYERKMLWANLTIVIGNNVDYRKDSYYIDKKHNEIIVDMLMAERFVKNNKEGWGK